MDSTMTGSGQASIASATERGIDARQARRPAAFGVMLHLLGAAATGFASLVWAALLLLQVVTGSGLRVSFVFAGLAVSALWTIWLVVVSREWEVLDEDVTERSPVSGMVAAPWVGVDCDGLDDALLPLWTREPAGARRRLLHGHAGPRRPVLGAALTASA